MSTQAALRIEKIPLNDIFLDESWNCRGVIPVADVVGLARQIKDQGLIQPVVLRPYDKDGFKFKMVVGHRRFKAVKYNGDFEITAIIRDDIDDLQASIMNLEENIARKDLNILQEAKAIQRYEVLGYDKTELADLLKVPENWIVTRWILNKLPTDIQTEAAAGVLSAQQIKDLYKIKDETKRYAYVKKIKDAKERSEKVKAPVEKLRSPTERRLRKPPEIQAMIDEIADVCGYNVITAALAWANGNATNFDLYRSFKEYCDENKIEFEIPPEMIFNG